MVTVWASIAKVRTDVRAILVTLKSFLQIVACAPRAMLWISMKSALGAFDLRYGQIAIVALIHLICLLVAGVGTRSSISGLLGRDRFDFFFLPSLIPVSLLGLFQDRHLSGEQAGRVRAASPRAYFPLFCSAHPLLCHLIECNIRLRTVHGL